MLAGLLNSPSKNTTKELPGRGSLEALEGLASRHLGRDHCSLIGANQAKHALKSS